MRYNIPQDWDGETWTCYQIQWPDSDRWLWLLQGILSGLSKGRTWNENSGSIIAAQIVGELIWQRNKDLLTCEGAPVEPGDENDQQAGGAGAACFYDESEDDMPCIDLTTLIKVEDGHLWVKDSCCSWVDIGAISGVEAQQPLPDVPLDPNNNEPTYSGCGKAAAITSVIFAIADEAWQQGTPPIEALTPWTWVHDVEQAAKVDLDNLWVIDACMQAFDMQMTGYEGEEVMDTPAEDWLRCFLATRFTDTAAAPTEDDFKAARDAMVNHVFPDPFLMNWWTYIFNCLGWKDMSKIGALGALTTTANCDCPVLGQLVTPADLWEWPWIHQMNLTTRSTAPTHYTILSSEGAWHLASEGYPANGYWSTVNTQYRRTKVQIVAEQGGGTVRNIAFKFKRAAAATWYNDPAILVSGTAIGTLANCPDQDPSNGDYFWWVLSCNLAVDMDNMPYVDLPSLLADHYDEELFACGVVGVAIGGTGTDPFTTDPDA